MTKNYQASYQGKVIERILGEKKMKEFHEDYKNACYSRGSHKVIIGDKEMKLLEMFKSGKTFSEIGRTAKLSQSEVRTIILYAALKKI